MTGWDGFAKYVGIQGVIALILTIAVVIMLIMKLTIPPELYGPWGIALGFYFAKNGYNITQIGKK